MVPEPQFDELYRELILDHYRKPRNRGSLPNAGLHLEGMNPVCGDEVRLDVVLQDGRIGEIAFDGMGCSISQASTSMLTERVKNRTVAEAEEVAARFQEMLVDGAEPSAELGDLEAFAGVAKFPVRVKCALLSWKVLTDGLKSARNGREER